MQFSVQWKFTFLSGLFLQSSNNESSSEDARKAHYFLPEPVIARFMRFTADQVNNSRCLSDLVVSGCTVGKIHMSTSFILETYTETLVRVLRSFH